MILLDTQVWIWWTAQSELPPHLQAALEMHRRQGLGVSLISCWEVAKKVERGKLGLGRSLDARLASAIRAPGVVLLDITVADVVESTRLPGDFHRDPADQIIVATARNRGLVVATTDRAIIGYPHVETA